MTDNEQLVFRKGQMDRDLGLCYYRGGEGVFTVGEGHLGKSWKTAQKGRNGKKHWKVKVANLRGNRNKVSKNAGLYRSDIT